jgi:hypothetical protein
VRSTIGLSSALILAPLPRECERFRSTNSPVAEALVDGRQARINTTAVSDAEACFFWSDAAAR